MDMDRVNMFKHPEIADVPWTWSTLRAGDCIFVPAGETTTFDLCSFSLLLHNETEKEKNSL